MKAAEIHERLTKALDELTPIVGRLEGDMRLDTVFALGELTGVIAKVKALVGRDIDDAWDADKAPIRQVSQELREKIKRDMSGSGQ